MNGLESRFSNFSYSRVVMVGMRIPRAASKAGKLGKLLVYAPIALEVLNMLRQNQKKKQGKYVKARKRDQAFDFALDKANRLFGKKKPAKKRGWF